MGESEPSETFWIELEYKALRDEMISLTTRREGALRFFLTAASSVYIVPYALKRTDDSSLWTVCVAVSGLLLLAMVRSMFSCTAGVCRIGVYIREHLEEKSKGGLIWEHVVSRFDQANLRVGSTFTVAGIALVANLVAAISAERIFLRPYAIGWPGIAAGVALLLASPSLWMMSDLSFLRRQCTSSILAAIEAEARERNASLSANVSKATIAASEELL
jgi:hypothetical protein